MAWYILIIALFNTAIIMGMVYKLEQIRNKEGSSNLLIYDEPDEDDIITDDDDEWVWK